VVTKQELEQYRSARQELAEIKAKARQAELAGDAMAARETAAMYSAFAEERADELLRIETEIDALSSADQRRAVRMRYVDGMNRIQVAQRMHVSESAVDKYVAAALRELERE
jgi:DNA-directed RNA polymerase specialized sigma24 family protein